MVYDRYGSDLVVEFDRTGSPGLATQVTQPRNTNFSDAPRYAQGLPAVPAAPKAAYVKAGTGDIAVSTKVDGIPQRMILNPLLQRIEGSGRIAMWARAIEAGLEMKRQTGMSWGQVLATARAMTSHGEMPLSAAITPPTTGQSIMVMPLAASPSEISRATAPPRVEVSM